MPDSNVFLRRAMSTTWSWARPLAGEAWARRWSGASSTIRPSIGCGPSGREPRTHGVLRSAGFRRDGEHVMFLVRRDRNHRLVRPGPPARRPARLAGDPRRRRAPPSPGPGLRDAARARVPTLAESRRAAAVRAARWSGPETRLGAFPPRARLVRSGRCLSARIKPAAGEVEATRRVRSQARGPESRAPSTAAGPDRSTAHNRHKHVRGTGVQSGA